MFEIASRNLDVIHAVKFCPAKIFADENIVVVQEFVAGVFFFNAAKLHRRNHFTWE